jgi:hypothetical protein
LLCKPHKANGAKGGEGARTRQDIAHDGAEATLDAYVDYDYDFSFNWEIEAGWPETFHFVSSAELARAGKTEACPCAVHNDPINERLNLCPLCAMQMWVTPDEAAAYRLGGLLVAKELSG